jgi:hypothetical protein
LLITAWILFKHLWISTATDQWSAAVRLVLGYIVFMINVYQLLYFYRTYLFFHYMLAPGNLKSKLVFAYTCMLALFIVLSLFYIVIYSPTVLLVPSIESSTYLQSDTHVGLDSTLRFVSEVCTFLMAFYLLMVL